MRPGWISRIAATAVAAAVVGLIVAACGDAAEAPTAAAQPASVERSGAEQTAAERRTVRGAPPTAAPQVQATTPEAPTATPEATAAVATGARPGGAGFLGGRFGGAGLEDAVVAAIAEAAGTSEEEVQSLQESGLTLTEIIEAEGLDRDGVVDDVVDRILASFPGPGGGQAGAGGADGGAPGGGARGGRFGGGGFAGGGGGGFDPSAALRNAVNALIDGEAPVAPSGDRQFVGMGQVIINVVAERTGREPAEVREARAGGQSFASLLFVAGQDVDAAIDAIVEAIESNATAATRPEGAPAPPTGEDLRAAIEAIMYATDDSEAEAAPSPPQGT